MFRALCVAACSSMMFAAAPAAAQAPPYRHLGIRWIGSSPVPCRAPLGWRADPLFPRPKVPPNSADLCVYTWTDPVLPTASDVAALFAGTGGAVQMEEDVPVLSPMEAARSWTSAELSYFAGLRAAVRQQVGSASQLPVWPAQRAARIVVVDSAPTAGHGALVAGGGSRHGDTLARLIEDIVCLPVQNGMPRACAAEVATELALPWTSPGVLGVAGGHTGTLIDLTRAIHAATVRWELDRVASPSTTPRQLILNLSLGWEHHPGIADCSSDPGGGPLSSGLPAWAVKLALQYAASKDVLIIAAAGNDSGGPSPRSGPTCPGNYQRLPQQARPTLPVLTAVSGVDYADRPLESARPFGHTGLVGLGLGGVAWQGPDAAPPALVGSSVATAVVSAVSAVTWAFRPTWSASQIITVVHDGGVRTGHTADACSPFLDDCATRRANVCGALSAAGASFRCTPTPAKQEGSPSLPSEISSLRASFAVPPSNATIVPPPLAGVPRDLMASSQLEPWTFPTPISATCPTCIVGASAGAGPWELLLPAVGRTLLDPMLILRFDNGSIQGFELGHQLVAGLTYVFPIPAFTGAGRIHSAYLTGLDAQQQHSITEQLVTER
jgi:hypothetical protein